MVSSLSPTIRDRFPSLDGLRGVAAFVVLAHHTAMILPGMAAAYTGLAAPAAGSATWWFSFTPLRLLTAGSEAVIVFFVLSGFVLTLPVLRSPAFDWLSYYPRRLIRIGLPAVASVLFAFALLLLVPRVVGAGVSPWLASFHIDPVTWRVLAAALDPFSADHRINGPLWSIYWEMVFSMTLPLFVGLAVLARRHWAVLLVGATLLAIAGAHANADGFRYLPAFFVGTVAAVCLPGIRASGTALSARRFGHVAWAAILLSSCLLLILRWLVPLPAGAGVLLSAMNGLWPLAALGIVVCCFEWGPAVRLLSTRPFLWAGRISFSLYLVHVPILFAFRSALAGLPLAVVLPLAAATAICAAMLFFWLVEKRSHALARRLGDRVAGAVRHPAELADGS